MNLVLAETEEFRVTKKSIAAARKAANNNNNNNSNNNEQATPIRETKRSLGLVILRGEHVISVSVEAPPPTSDPSARLGGLGTGAGASAGGAGVVAQGAGFAKPINRTGGAPGSALAGPTRTTAASFFGGSGGMSGGPGGVPPGFQPPPGFGGRWLKI